VILAGIHLMDVLLGASKTPGKSMEQASKLAQKAIGLDSSLASGCSLLSYIYTLQRQYEKAIVEAERAVALEPNMADAYFCQGMALHFVGEYEEAVFLLKKAIRLNPIPPTIYFLILGNAYQLSGMYEESIEVYRKAINSDPNNLFPHMRLAATYSLLDREEEARAEALEVLELDPKFSVEYFIKAVPYKNQADKELLVNALRKVGLK
jgi:adenylate cyclase